MPKGMEQTYGWLVFVGAVLWGLIGIGNFIGTNLNVVEMLDGAVGLNGLLANVVYILVGVSAVLGFKRLTKK